MHLKQTAEEILWNKLPSNATILGSLERHKLKNENSLPEMRRLLGHLGYQSADLDKLRIIHIAGSKGKGSTAAFTETILREHGLRTALFTSPHLVHPRERLRLDGKSMDMVEFSRAVIETYLRLSRAADDQLELPLPGLFRFLTLVALDVMLKKQLQGLLDVAILEVGMGGRYDCTNIVERPVVTAITSLALEHVRQLGPTLADIAGHKVGIAKSGVPLLSAPQPGEAADVLKREATKVGSPLSFIDAGHLSHIGLETIVPCNNFAGLAPSPTNAPPFIAIAGEHQLLNAAIAVEICRLWFKRTVSREWICPAKDQAKITPSLQKTSVARALQTTDWPGRHQIFTDADVTWYLDGAHTIESLQYAIEWFGRHRLPVCDGILMFHCSHDRSYEHLLRPLVEAHLKNGTMFTSALFARPWSPLDRGIDLRLHEQMALYWTQKTGLPGQAITTHDIPSFPSLRRLPQGRRAQVLVTGSLYLVGDLLRLLKVPIP